MCLPGQHMVRRQSENCEIECVTCKGNRFSASHNVEQSCFVCETCEKPNMELKTNCTATSNAVCTCKAGFKCSDQVCTECVPTPPTIKPDLPVASTATTLRELATTQAPLEPNRDTVWFLVIVALLCAGIGLVLTAKLKPFLLWIRLNRGYVLTQNTQKPPPAEDESVSKPVQEMCGKCDQPIVMCIKD
ncbi:tumor necrosis factor receptor superfamily member 19 [Menidia menidia]